MTKLTTAKLLLSSISMITLSGCGLANLSRGYTPAEKQAVADLSPSKFTPRSADERAAILTQDLFAQAAFWSREYDLNPADLEAAINLASSLRRLGNPSKAVEITQTTRALYPRNVELIAEMAAGLIASNNLQDAIPLIDQGLAAQPNNARLWSMKGATLDQFEQYDQARQSYGRALAITPNDPNILANVGLSYALEGDPKTAEIWLRRAVSMPGATAGARQNLALVLGLQNKFDEAEQWARRDLDAQSAQNDIDMLRGLRGVSQTHSAPNHEQTIRVGQVVGQQINPYAPTPTAQPTRQLTRKYSQQQATASSPYTPRTYGGASTAKPQTAQSVGRAPQTYQQSSPASQPVLKSYGYRAPQTTNNMPERQLAPQPTPQATRSPTMFTKQAAQFPGMRLSLANDASAGGAAPQTARDMAIAAARNNPKYTDRIPAMQQQQRPQINTPTVPQDLLGQLSRKNMSKQVIAQQKRAQNAQRAQMARQQQVQNPYVQPQQHYAQPQPPRAQYGQPQPQYIQAQNGAQYGGQPTYGPAIPNVDVTYPNAEPQQTAQQSQYVRPPARARRR